MCGFCHVHLQVLDLSGNRIASCKGLENNCFLLDVNLEENEVCLHNYVCQLLSNGYKSLNLAAYRNVHTWHCTTLVWYPMLLVKKIGLQLWLLIKDSRTWKQWKCKRNVTMHDFSQLVPQDYNNYTNSLSRIFSENYLIILRLLILRRWGTWMASGSWRHSTYQRIL